MEGGEFKKCCDCREAAAEQVKRRGEILISVVVPVYNAVRTLEYTVGSILSPSFFDSCELILVDDGSTDGSGEICDRFSLVDERISVIHKVNGGVSSARNAGISAAAGHYVTFVDADDILPKDCLSDWISTISAEETADIYIGGYRLLSGSVVAEAPAQNRLYSRGELSEFIDDNLSDDGSYLRPVWGKLFRKSFLDESALVFDGALSYGEDMLFLFRCLICCRSVMTVSRCVYVYRSGMSGGLSSDLSSDRHLMRIMLLLGSYSETIHAMEAVFPQSEKVSLLYHRDLVGRLICRILTVFATRRTGLCTSDNISRLYHYMRADALLNRAGGIFSLRRGQVPNLVLYRLSSPRFSASFYKVSAAVCETFRIRLKRY